VDSVKSIAKNIWGGLKLKHPGIIQFLVFFILSNGVTLFQMILMPFLRGIFYATGLAAVPFQVFPVGHNVDGSRYYIFNYAAGPIAPDGSGGGLAYFLAVQTTIGIAQVINFFAQRTITFKSKSSIARAAFWYILAYIVITLAAGAFQGLYKAPLYNFLMRNLDTAGETLADIVTMIINSAISFWVFFPIFKLIFRGGPPRTAAAGTTGAAAPPGPA
jgi:putative flippase GtrA